jgi:hypothetical protein
MEQPRPSRRNWRPATQRDDSAVRTSTQPPFVAPASLPAGPVATGGSCELDILRCNDLDVAVKRRRDRLLTATYSGIASGWRRHASFFERPIGTDNSPRASNPRSMRSEGRRLVCKAVMLPCPRKTICERQNDIGNERSRDHNGKLEQPWGAGYTSHHDLGRSKCMDSCATRILHFIDG